VSKIGRGRKEGGTADTYCLRIAEIGSGLMKEVQLIPEKLGPRHNVLD
jgi:hypothetical protein